METHSQSSNCDTIAPLIAAGLATISIPEPESLLQVLRGAAFTGDEKRKERKCAGFLE